MKGHIRERSPRHWATILDTHDPATGKRRRKWHSFKGTKREAQRKCADLISAMQHGTYIEPNKMTVSEFLDRWLQDAKIRVSPKTYERYEQLCHKNIVPLLGAVLLSKLDPPQISAGYAKALEGGRRNGNGGLSRRTVHNMHVIFKSALKQAVQWGWLVRNPAPRAPGFEQKPMQTYDLAQTAELLEALRGKRIFVAVLLAVLCGLRRGEIAALRWGKVDLSQATLSVVQSAEQTKDGVRYKEPKNGRSRTVAVPAMLLAELKAHRVGQAEERLKLGKRLSDDDFVVAQADGSPYQPHSLAQEWVRFLANHPALPRIRFHDLRHAHATHMLKAGVHPKIATERLGHSKIGITLDLYSHVLPNMQADAAAIVDDALQAAVQNRSGKIG